MKDKLSLCESCYCMTKTFDGKCGKCKKVKDQRAKQSSRKFLGEWVDPLADVGGALKNSIAK